MASKYCMLFPGQGSQYVGMCRKIAGNPAVRRLFDKASEVLQYNLLKICLEGPEETLEDTIHCQPAVVVASLAAVEQLRKEKPQVISRSIHISLLMYIHEMLEFYARLCVCLFVLVYMCTLMYVCICKCMILYVCVCAYVCVWGWGEGHMLQSIHDFMSIHFHPRSI